MIRNHPPTLGTIAIFGLLASAGCTRATETPHAETVTYRAGAAPLRGLVYKPAGRGPFPAVLYNHGSAPGFANNEAFDAIAPVFVSRGFVFFAPYRRGQGLSADGGPYVMDVVSAARARGGLGAAAEALTALLTTDHLDDQMAALAWLRAQPFVRPQQIATMGNSFGGIQALLGAERGGYCAAVDVAGGAESWKDAPALREVMVRAARRAATPILFFQAANDFDTEPTRVLHAERTAAGRPTEMRIYPRFGFTRRAGHSLAYRGVEIWRDDVVGFIERHCRETPASPRAPAH
jgi:carboxymethylenebutenolidase